MVQAVAHNLFARGGPSGVIPEQLFAARAVRSSFINQPPELTSPTTGVERAQAETKTRVEKSSSGTRELQLSCTLQ